MGYYMYYQSKMARSIGYNQQVAKETFGIMLINSCRKSGRHFEGAK
jgi:hypothetical protein